MEPEGSYNFQKNPPLFRILSQMNSVHPSYPIYLTSTLLLSSSHLCLGLPSSLLNSYFPSKFFMRQSPHAFYMSSQSYSPKFDDPNNNFGKSTICETPRYEIFSILLLFVPPHIETFLIASLSQIKPWHKDELLNGLCFVHDRLTEPYTSRHDHLEIWCDWGLRNAFLTV
jgi:hypothetical protein